MSALKRLVVNADDFGFTREVNVYAEFSSPVLEAVCRVAEEFRIPWVRKPFLLRPRGCRTTDHFAGFGLTGRLDTPALLGLIHSLRPGTTELMCRPGRCGPELRAARTRLKESREREVEALRAPQTRQALEIAQVTLVSFRELYPNPGCCA